METWNEVYASAKKKTTKCRCCLTCNGIACKGETPGVGGKGSGASFIRNVSKLKEVFLNLDTICNNDQISTESLFFDYKVALPVYAAPIGGIESNYGVSMSDYEYNKALVEGCLLANTLAFSGDGQYPNMYEEPLSIIKEHNGLGIPTIKPWDKVNIEWRIKAANEANAIAIASDIDAAGLTHLRNSATPVEYKDVNALKEFKKLCNKPIIIKGIMSVKGALKALEANADAIVVSNHGGRVLDDTLSSIEVLEDIVKAVDGKMKVFIDGGFRTGIDVFKALALGADGVLIGRFTSLAVIGDGSNGVKIYLDKIQSELKDTMALCGCKNIKDITRDCVITKFK
ncbi:MAG: alpha-hydroxy-acid oxidizing protein [Erysipelotrichaceae bacterium]